MRRVLLSALLVVGCPKPTTVPNGDPAPDAESPSPPPPQSMTACPTDEPFVTLGWVPSSAEALVLIDMNAAGLPDALAQLSEGANSPERQLPIRVAFALGQWTWQIPLLRTTLSQAGFAPAQLVHVMLPDGVSGWAWPQSCDLATIADNLDRGWGLTLRRTAYGAAALAPRTDGGALAFPYDFIAYGGSAYLLVPAGTAQAVAQRLAERLADTPSPGLGEQAAALVPAPLRLSIRNRALLTPGSEPPPQENIAVHRVDADGWSGS